MNVVFLITVVLLSIARSLRSSCYLRPTTTASNCGLMTMTLGSKEQHFPDTSLLYGTLVLRFAGIFNCLEFFCPIEI